MRRSITCYREIEMACHDEEEMAYHSEKETACCVRGYNVYKDIWAAAIGEVLVCSRAGANQHG